MVYIRYIARAIKCAAASDTCARIYKNRSSSFSLDVHIFFRPGRYLAKMACLRAVGIRGVVITEKTYIIYPMIIRPAKSNALIFRPDCTSGKKEGASDNTTMGFRSIVITAKLTSRISFIRLEE